MTSIEFYISHIETLCDLKAIAEKHNCKISFGVKSYSENTIDEELLKQEGFTDDEINYIKDSLDVVDACTTNDSIYFELIEKDSKKVNSPIYVKSSTTYRSGMALKYFANLVCDYLDEPRIERVN